LVKRALLSVSDKTGIVDFAKGLKELGIEIISTGGTAKILKNEGLEIVEVDEVTGFPEMMNGRVKSLHPKIHGGILCDRNNSKHLDDLKKGNIELIDIVAVNLYPFKETISKENTTIEQAIESIDIGGPTLIRAAAKNYKAVTVVCNPYYYSVILDQLKSYGDTLPETKELLATKAFKHTADYDSLIDIYLSKQLLNEDVTRLSYIDGKELRYGENWHQRATVYTEPDLKYPSIAKAKQLHGKALSYNNYVDADNALKTVKEIDPSIPTVSIVKHNNPCGFATGNSLVEALKSAWDGDPISGFGSIICTNKPFDLSSAEFLKGRFIEMVIAPSFDSNALEYLKKKSSKLRILEIPNLTDDYPNYQTYKFIDGGLLKQSKNSELYNKWECVTTEYFPSEKKNLAEFALKACKSIKSNAVSIGYEYKKGCFMLLAMGAGQPNRVDSIRKLASTKAKENLKVIYDREHIDIPFDKYCKDVLSNCVMASDAFFPFDDSIVHAAESDIKFIVSPGGSIRDQEVIDTANKLGVSMIFTGMRHFLH